MTIKINGKKHLLPESWADVAVKQKEKLFDLLLRYEEKEAKMIVLRILLDIPTAMFMNIKPNDIAVMLRQLDWFSLSPSATPVQSYFEIKRTRYYFPKANFELGTSLEFLHIQELYNEFRAAKYPLSIGILQRIAAVLVREMDKKTKKRIVLLENDDKLFERENTFKTLSVAQSMMVLKYTEGVLSLVESVGTQFRIFGEAQTEGTDTASVNLFGWKSVFRGIAAEGPYAGGYDEVLQRPFWEIIEILAERAALQAAQTTATNDINGN